MTTQTLTTTNFVISYDDDPAKPGTKRAMALAASCEREFNVLTGWFGITDGFGTDNRVQVGLTLPDGAGRSNSRYQTGGASNMSLDAQLGNGNDANADQIVRMIFVAELVEIFMGKRGQQGSGTWNPGDSNGEGLSQLCALLRAPVGHALYYNIWVNTWLQSASRTDWISSAEGTDAKPDSFGCALLFLYYLHSQLSLDVPTIIQKGGGTLEATYLALTGKTGAYIAFRALLDRYFPFGSTPALLTNDPFPLLDGNSREVEIDYDTQAIPPDFPVGLPGSVTVSPLPGICPKRTYRYQLYSTPKRLICTVSTRGFGQPRYSWTVNGLALAGTIGTVNPTVDLSTDDPTAPSTRSRPTPTAIPVDYSITQPTAFTSQIDLSFPGTEGHFVLTPEVAAVELFASSDPRTDIDWADLHTSRIGWEQQYYDDQAACGKALHDVITHYVRLAPHFALWRTLPDPPPEFSAVMSQVVHLAHEIDAIARQSPNDAQLIERGLAQHLGLSVEQFRGLRAGMS